MSVKLDSRYRLPLGVIIGVIVFLAVGFGLNNGTLGAFLAGLVAAIVGASKTKTYGRGAYFFTAIISVIIPLIIVVIGNAFLVLVLCAVGGIIGNAFGRRFLKI
jgi:hypothetical protein